VFYLSRKREGGKHEVREEWNMRIESREGRAWREGSGEVTTGNRGGWRTERGEGNGEKKSDKEEWEMWSVLEG
jgi:hypothetical protein